MREVVFEDGRKVVRSPWLRIEEAAAYCGISRSMFDDRAVAVDLPHGGDNRTRLYHTEVLDRWINGLLDIPFLPAPAKRRQRRIRLTAKQDEQQALLVNPVNGKVYRPKG